MTGFLIDTNVALIAASEIVLKSMKGKLIVGEPRAWWEDTLQQLAATPLILRPEHVDQITRLPGIHHDPFDRVLIAQAMIENLIFITTDEAISRLLHCDE